VLPKPIAWPLVGIPPSPSPELAASASSFGDSTGGRSDGSRLPYPVYVPRAGRFCTVAKSSRTSLRATVSLSRSRSTSASRTSLYSVSTSHASSCADSISRLISSSIDDAISSE
jgi:hypothetical protein